jgi:hypothetical protein
MALGLPHRAGFQPACRRARVTGGPQKGALSGRARRDPAGFAGVLTAVQTEMTMRFLLLALAAVVPLSSAAADPADCQRSSDRFAMAANDADRAARDYRACIWSGRGDTCSVAWDRLDNANDHFQSAASDVRDDCGH